jgi:hypothetical protein
VTEPTAQQAVNVAAKAGETGLFGIPIDRVVAWLGPLIATVSAAFVTWLLTKVNLLGIPGLDKANLQTYVTAGVTFLAVAGLHALGGWKWLRGRHILLEQGKN